jgi:ABC-type uncharacterized transport system substrate-binding protein
VSAGRPLLPTTNNNGLKEGDCKQTPARLLTKEYPTFTTANGEATSCDVGKTPYHFMLAINDNAVIMFFVVFLNESLARRWRDKQTF